MQRLRVASPTLPYNLTTKLLPVDDVRVARSASTSQEYAPDILIGRGITECGLLRLIARRNGRCEFYRTIRPLETDHWRVGCHWRRVHAAVDRARVVVPYRAMSKRVAKS